MNRKDAFLRIAAEFDNLLAAKAFVCRRAEMMGVPENLWSKLELVVEELFLNIVDHAQPKSGTGVEIICLRQSVGDYPEEMFCISVRDWGPPFNPLEKEAPALEQDLDGRPIGGLGIYLIIQMVDYCNYVREDECNLFTACFCMN